MPLDTTKPVQTRDGRKARILCTDYNGSDIVAAVHLSVGGSGEFLCSYNAAGRMAYGCDEEGSKDLVNVPEEAVKYVNVYSDDIGVFHESEDEAAWCKAGCPQGRLRLVIRDGKLVSAEVL